MATKKYLSLEKLTEYDGLIKAKIDSGDESSLSSAKTYTNQEIAKITGGTSIVKEAEHSASSDVLSTARTISLTGDATGAVSFDGSKDVSINVTITDDSHNHVISDVDGLETTLNGLQESIDSIQDAVASSHDHDDRYYTETEIDTMLTGYASSTHNHDAAYDSKGAADTALESANTYTDQEIAKLLNNSSEAVDSIYELRDAMQENAGAIEALNSIAGSKADATHKHATSDITGLDTALSNASSAINTNTDSINLHTQRITALETKVGDGFAEITSAEVQALFA